MLVENGCVVQHALDKELITMHELEAAAHKQGFESLKEVEKCILEPGGTLAMFGRKPSSDDVRQRGGDAAPRSHRGAAAIGVSARDYLTKSISR